MSKRKVPKIEGLTKKQQDILPEYLDKYENIALSTTPANRELANEAFRELATYLKLPVPRITWVDSPLQGAILAAKISEDKTEKFSESLGETVTTELLQKTRQEIDAEKIKEQYSKCSYGTMESYWVGFYTYISDNFPDVKKDNLLGIMNRLIENTGPSWVFEKHVIVSEKPVAVHIKDGVLHNPNGLALEYKDGTGLFSIEGKRYKSLLDMELAASQVS